MQLVLSAISRRRSKLFYSVLSLALVLWAVTNLNIWTATRWVFEKCVDKTQRHIPADIFEASGNSDNYTILSRRKIAIAKSKSFGKAMLSRNGLNTSNIDLETVYVVRTMTTESPLFPPPRSPEMYVRNIKIGRSRMGNIMFQYIGTYLTALRLGLKFVVMAEGVQLKAYQQLSSLFKVSAPLFSEVFPNDSVIIREQGFGIYTPALLWPEQYQPYTQIRAYLQSWRYFAGFEQFVRKEFALRDRYVAFVNEFFAKNGIHLNAGNQDKNVTLIAVHVRRGDFLDHLDQFKVASPEYLVHAISHFREQYAKQQPIFIVATDDLLWTQDILDSFFLNDGVSVLYANGTAEEDLAVLSSCHHAIITSGTYGWWVAWLAGGSVMYFRDYIWNGSVEWRKFNADDYYPAHWIGRA